MSRTFFPTRMRVARSRMTFAAPEISSTVSPFILRAVMNAPIWAGVASPDMIWFMTSIISDSERS